MLRFNIERDELFLQLLTDYILLNEISAGGLNEHLLDKVGLKSGLRLEDSYRSIQKLAEKLKPAQFADLAINFTSSLGGQYVLEFCDHNRLVFACHECIFGLLSLKAPGLCRIMQAILGGIAARNFHYCKISSEKYGSGTAPVCKMIFYLKETDDASSASGIVFTEDPSSYLLTPRELKRYGEVKYKEDFKNLESTHRELEAQYNQLRDEIFSDLRLGILTINEQVEIAYINNAARNLLELNSGQNISIPHNFKGLLESTLREGARFNQYELVMPFTDGARYYSFNTAPFVNDGGSVSGAVGVFQDVSEKKHLEKEMLQMEKFSLVAELAAGTAHEIRNPMTTIRGFLQILSKEFKSGSRGSEYCMLMIDEIDRANNIIKEFLLLTKPAAPNLEDMDLYLILDDIFLLIESKSLLENVSLEKDFCDNLPPVRIDSAQIKQVLLNLAANAIQAMPGGGRLTISASACGGKAFVKFKDTGCGIDEAITKKIFDPFFTTKENGTGLGLAISYRIMEAHGGHLFVESVPGQGSTFTVELPALITKNASGC
ncbi:MAG: PAS domain-containing protein [Dethiobacter sp.]|jgi:two-component system sensor histidine kinase AtoS|nr:PAS domain-containing protein [Dethiobacter sp.]